jgi:hypothetical protein
MRLVLSFLLVICSSIGYANNLEASYVTAVQQVISYVDQNNNAVWPGYHISATPTVIYFSDSKHTYAYSFHPTNPDWQLLNVLKQPVYYLGNDDLHLDGLDMLFRTQIDNQTVFASVMPRPNTSYHNDVALDMEELAHERFHAYQVFESKFTRSSWPSYDGFNQIENVKLVYLELAAFKTYLLSSGLLAEQALTDAVAIHQFRQTLLNKDSLAYEKSKEVGEGTASYTGFQAANLSPEEYKHRATTIGYYISTKAEVDNCLWSMRYYLTGLISGYALDKKTQGFTWKTEVEKDGHPIEDVLLNYYHLDQASVKQYVENAKLNPNYSYAMISKKLDGIMLPFLKNLQQLQDDFRSQPGIELQRFFSLCEDDGSISSDESYKVNSQLVLQKNPRGKLNCTDHSLEINFKSVALLYNSHRAGEPYGIHPTDDWQAFKLSPGTKVIIDGKENPIEYYVGERKIFNFHQLQIINPQIEIHINNIEGSLDTRDSKVILNFKREGG